MGYTATTVRLETNLKNEFDAVCKAMGMNANVAINIFARAVVREKCIPFLVQAPERIYRANAADAFAAIREQVEKAAYPEISEEEIENEIALSREGK